MSAATVKNLHDLIDEYFREPEVNEVALFLLKREYVQDITELAAHAERTDVPAIPPEILREVMEGEDGLSNNTFYTHNFAALRTAMALATIRVQTKAFHLGLVAARNNAKSDLVVNSLAIGYADSLSTVAFLALGMAEAKDFDRKARLAVARGGDNSVNLMEVLRS